MSCDFATQFPTLARLALSDEQRQALRQGGFVAVERQGAGKRVVKLRFRCGGRQQVRYLGASAEIAARARRELDRLQAERQLDRDLRRQVRAARRALRAAKRASAPLLARLGLAYHGFAIRRPRPGRRPSPTAAQETHSSFHSHIPANSKEDDLHVQ